MYVPSPRQDAFPIESPESLQHSLTHASIGDEDCYRSVCIKLQHIYIYIYVCTGRTKCAAHDRQDRQTARESLVSCLFDLQFFFLQIGRKTQERESTTIVVVTSLAFALNKTQEFKHLLNPHSY